MQIMLYGQLDMFGRIFQGHDKEICHFAFIFFLKILAFSYLSGKHIHSYVWIFSALIDIILIIVSFFLWDEVLQFHLNYDALDEISRLNKEYSRICKLYSPQDFLTVTNLLFSISLVLVAYFKMPKVKDNSDILDME